MYFVCVYEYPPVLHVVHVVVLPQVCYKVYAIHMASQHGALEMVMLEEGAQAR